MTKDAKIRITLTNRDWIMVRSEDGGRLSIGFSACGYLTICEGDRCCYKEKLSEIRNIFVEIPGHRIVAYRRGW